MMGVSGEQQRKRAGRKTERGQKEEGKTVLRVRKRGKWGAVGYRRGNGTSDGSGKGYG